MLSPQRDIGLGGAHLPEPHVVGVNTAQEMRTLLRSRSEAGINWRYTISDQISKARAISEISATVKKYDSYPRVATVASSSSKRARAFVI